MFRDPKVTIGMPRCPSRLFSPNAQLCAVEKVDVDHAK